jgi:serine/threonine protein kinase
VLLADDGTPRLTDFGIAYMGERERVTSTGALVGTLDYLSPEMFRSEPIEALTDIWAFGVMLFEMLTGQRPFSRSSFAETMSAILIAPPPDLEMLRPDAPVALVDLIYRMLEKDRSARIPSVRQVGAALESILHHQESDVGVSIPVSPAETRRFETPTPAPDVIKHNLPKQPTPFMGREQELAALLTQLADPQTALVTIFAPGGMGKTRLALEAAERLSRGESPNLTFPNGVYLVELAALMEAESQLERAVELATLVQQHRKAYAVDKERAGRLLESLRAQLSPEAFAAAVERGKLLEIESAVQAFLVE